MRLARGVDLFEADDLTAALDFFKTVTRGSDSAWVDFYVGRIHLQQDEIDEAVERLSASVEADPEGSLFVLWLGDAYVQKIDEVGMLKKMRVAKESTSEL